MAQPEYLLNQLRLLSGRSDVTNLIDAWMAYFTAHGVPLMSLADRVSYHAMLRGLTPAQVWAGNIEAPSLQFITAARGFALDAGNISTLWQDVAGTVPVTAAGQAVARVDDVSGKGNHALQATVAAQPLYQVDAFGNGYLQFDGVDDQLVVAALDLSTELQATLLLAARRDSPSQTDIILEQGASFTALPGAFMVNLTASNQLRFNVAQAAGNSTLGYAVTSPSDTSWVASARIVPSGPAIEDTVQNLRIGRDNPTTAYLGVVDPVATLAAGDVFIGARSGPANPFAGRLYGAAVRSGGVSSADQQRLMDYYLCKIGAV